MGLVAEQESAAAITADVQIKSMAMNRRGERGCSAGREPARVLFASELNRQAGDPFENLHLSTIPRGKKPRQLWWGFYVGGRVEGMGWFIVIIVVWLAALALILLFYLLPQVTWRFPSLTRLQLAEFIVTPEVA